MATFGKNILENLTTGMYYDSRVIYREYIQNACDQIDKALAMGLLEGSEGSVDIEIDIKTRTIIIRDNATGIPAADFRRQLEDIANSDKVRGVDKGFRGIGRLCGLAYCKTLTFTATAKGEPVRSVMTMNAELMRKMIASPEKYSVDDILNAITKFSEEEAPVDEHGFVVSMAGINRENTALLNKQAVIEYLSFVAPVPYENKFSLRHRIYAYAKELGYAIDEYRIFVEGCQIFKSYGMRLYDKADSSGNKKSYDNFIDIAFHDIKQDGQIIAWMWYGLYRFEKAIPKKENPMYGFRVRQSNIQIGDNTILAKFFKEERGNSYFVGEVFVVSPELTPNSQRDNFNENSIRVAFEDAIRKYCYEELNALYNKAAKVKNSFKWVGAYTTAVETLEQKREKGFVSEQERVDLEHKVEEAEKRKTEALRVIERIPASGSSSSDPSTIVQRAIKSHFDERETLRKAEAAERKQSTSENSQAEKPRYFTDSLSKLDKNKRKLVAQIMVIVSKHVNEETLNKIKTDIEKEFR